MIIEFRKIDLEKEVDLLVEMEAKIFSPSDRLRAENFEGTECYWIVTDSVIAGCTSLRNSYIATESYKLIWCEEAIHIVSTGILPEFQGKGFGNQIKEWQISYAKSRCCIVMTTVCRRGNLRMIGLNEKFGFKVSGTVTNSYHDPEEDGIIMALNLL